MGTPADMSHARASDAMPAWVPKGAVHYIAHTEDGAPIRALARAAGCHASTILRQIRKIEMRRDDPLVDAALRQLGAAGDGAERKKVQDRRKELSQQATHPLHVLPDEDALARKAMRVLRRLCETGAVLAVAAGLDKAVVVRDVAGGGTARTAVVDAAVAQAMALKDWIIPQNAGRIVRYQITGAGRQALTEFLDRFGPFKDTDDAADPNEGELDDLPSSGNRSRYGLAESPLSALARRRDKNGKPFLKSDLVQAGERLREDFELAQMEGGGAEGLDGYLKDDAPEPDTLPSIAATTPAAARARIKSAMQSLGPDLSDVLLRCCCYLEGLESVEKRLGWSARSAKVVLRIALTQLERHYEDTLGAEGQLIG